MSPPRLLLLIPTHGSTEISGLTGTIIPGCSRGLSSGRRGVPGNGEQLLLKKTSLHGAELDFGSSFPAGCSGCSALDPRVTFGDKPVVPRVPRMPRSCDSRDCSPGAQPLVGSRSRAEENKAPQLKSLLIAALHAALPLLSKFGAVITAAGKGSSCGPAAPSPAFQGFLDLTV